MNNDKTNETHTDPHVTERDFPDEQELKMRLRKKLQNIKQKILVLSGKGGVGKSTVAANLAAALAMEGRNVGLLDIDIHGPSIPGMIGLKDGCIQEGDSGLEPVALGNNLKVMSIGFMLRNKEDAVIWRGPMKYNLIQQFLRDVNWGELDYLVVDSPPGTGDEPLSIAQFLGRGAGAVIVTTPQDVAINDVRRCITFCRKLDLSILGVVENMSGFVCPECGTEVFPFKTGGGEIMAAQMDVPFLGRIPLDPMVVEACDQGRLHIYHHSKSLSAAAFNRIVTGIMEKAPL